MSDSVADLAIGFVAGGDATRVAQLEALPIDSLWTGGHVASTNTSRAARWGSVASAAFVITGDAGTPAASSLTAASRAACVMVQPRIASSSSSAAARRASCVG